MNKPGRKARRWSDRQLHFGLFNCSQSSPPDSHRFAVKPDAKVRHPSNPWINKNRIDQRPRIPASQPKTELVVWTKKRERVSKRKTVPKRILTIQDHTFQQRLDLPRMRTYKKNTRYQSMYRGALRQWKVGRTLWNERSRYENTKNTYVSQGMEIPVKVEYMEVLTTCKFWQAIRNAIVIMIQKRKNTRGGRAQGKGKRVS